MTGTRHARRRWLVAAGLTACVAAVVAQLALSARSEASPPSGPGPAAPATRPAATTPGPVGGPVTTDQDAAKYWTKERMQQAQPD